MTKRFGAFTALGDVSMHVRAGSLHALLGENGAGKSTLVKCMVGFYRADEGSIQVDARERTIDSATGRTCAGHRHGVSAFHADPVDDGGENLVMSRANVPAVLNWRREREALASFMANMPFR